MSNQNKKYNPMFENNSAYYNYFIEDHINAGIVLFGPEVCAIREGRANINDSFVFIDNNNECWIKNMYVKKDSNVMSFDDFDEYRDRKLLLNKSEISKLKKYADKLGNTLIPLKMFRKNGFFKIMVGFCKGKKDYDKRETIKQRDADREISRVMKNF